MYDIKWIRENPAAFDSAMKLRGTEASASNLIAMDEARRDHVAKLQEAQTRRNAVSKEIGAAMGAGDKDKAEALKAEVSEIKQFIQNNFRSNHCIIASFLLPIDLICGRAC